MPNNNGFLNEEELVYSINNQRFFNLNDNLQNFIKFLFPEIKKRGKLHAERVDDFVKPDILITYNYKKAYVSVKSGSSRTLHEENIYTFLTFLRGCGITNHTEKMLLLFIYGDGTIDGSGENRVGYQELYKKYKKHFDEANIEMNSAYSFVKRVVERAMFLGTNEDNVEANYIYYGDVFNGVIVSKYQIMKFIRSRLKKWSIFESPHAGPIVFKAAARYLNKPVLNPVRRKNIGLIWPHLKEDLEYISKNVPHFDIEVDTWENPKYKKENSSSR